MRTYRRVVFTPSRPKPCVPYIIHKFVLYLIRAFWASLWHHVSLWIHNELVYAISCSQKVEQLTQVCKSASGVKSFIFFECLFTLIHVFLTLNNFLSNIFFCINLSKVVKNVKSGQKFIVFFYKLLMMNLWHKGDKRKLKLRCVNILYYLFVCL